MMQGKNHPLDIDLTMQNYLDLLIYLQFSNLALIFMIIVIVLFVLYLSSCSSSPHNRRQFL